jgi:hypothetical protein
VEQEQAQLYQAVVVALVFLPQLMVQQQLVLAVVEVVVIQPQQALLLVAVEQVVEQQTGMLDKMPLQTLAVAVAVAVLTVLGPLAEMVALGL